MNKSLIVAVCGCMMQQEGAAERLVKTFPFVRIAFGTHNMHMLPEMIYKVITTGKRAVCIEKDSGLIVEDIPVHRNCPPLSYVSIMQGCDNFCSYCIVPYVRGREKSRSPEAIINEVKSLAEGGYKEVMLLGDDVCRKRFSGIAGRFSGIRGGHAKKSGGKTGNSSAVI